jgi:hydrogenase expression/formation protein HypC
MCLAVPGKIVSVEGADPDFRSARVDFGGIRKQVSLACTPEAGTGDYVLVHAGFALQVLDEQEAQRSLASIEQLLEEFGPE